MSATARFQMVTRTFRCRFTIRWQSGKHTQHTSGTRSSLPQGLCPCQSGLRSIPQIFDRLEREGYSVEKVLLETLPEFYLGGNLYRPLGKSGRFAGVASPHGHWAYG